MTRQKWCIVQLNIQNISKGKLFKDVTKIKDVTEAIMNSYGQSPKFQFLRTSSKDSITQSTENTTPTYSISEDSQGRKLSNEQIEFFKDSRVRDENGALKPVYHGTNKEFTKLNDPPKMVHRSTMEFAYEKTRAYGVPCILDTDAKNKLDKYCHLGMQNVSTRKISEDCYLYDLMREA